MTHFMEQRHADKEHVAARGSESKIVVRVLFELVDEIIVNFDLCTISSATISPGYTTLTII